MFIAAPNVTGFNLLQNLPGGRADQGSEEALSEARHVPENDRGGSQRTHAGGKPAEGRDETEIHAVEGDHQLDGHPGIQDRRSQGKACEGKWWDCAMLSITSIRCVSCTRT